MTFDVEVTRRTQRDIDRAYAWYEKRTPQGAVAWHTDILAALERLEILPGRGSIAEAESEAFGVEVRQLLCREHRILFTVERKTVFVLTVRHINENPSEPVVDGRGSDGSRGTHRA
jgi:plasmid stabilization system protein ParE